MKKNKQNQLDVVLQELQELHEQELLHPYQFLTIEELERKELLPIPDEERNWWDEPLEG